MFERIHQNIFWLKMARCSSWPWHLFFFQFISLFLLSTKALTKIAICNVRASSQFRPDSFNRFYNNMKLASSRKSFNPFTTRSRNKNIRWFNDELDAFYDFVQAQPMLNAQQEQQYGKAIKCGKMWRMFASI